MNQAYIVAAVRTAGGKRGGRMSGWHPVDLAAAVIDALQERTGADPALVDDVIMGCVSQVGEQSTNMARNAVPASRLPESVPGTSLDRQCGSSQQALHFAAQAVMSGSQDMVIAAAARIGESPRDSPRDAQRQRCGPTEKDPGAEAAGSLVSSMSWWALSDSNTRPTD